MPFTVSGTAVDGKNYRVMTPNPLTIRAGETTGVITVALMDDKQYEDTRDDHRDPREAGKCDAG